MFSPNSIEEFNQREESIERRQDALGRYRRQQFELFEENQLYPACPECGAYAKPVSLDLGTSSETGYHDAGDGCVECIDRAFIRRHSCAVCGIERGVECAHTGPHGIGIKAPDMDAIALCWFCHWGGNASLHKVGPQEFEKLHGLKIGALVKGYQAEWKDERRRGCQF